MTDSGFEAGARAAGALAFHADFEAARVTLNGAVGCFGLSSDVWTLTAFYDRLGPLDRKVIDAALRGGEIDRRIRIIGDDGRLYYARLLGQRGNGQFHGLLIPAGRSLQTSGRIEDEHALAAAVEAGEVCAFYQPVVALDTGRLAGFEALARWQRPGVGILAPADFLGMAEDIELLEQVSTRVRQTAIADLASWRKAYPSAQSLFVAANASVSELVCEEFQAELLDQVAAADLPASAFKLEVAETEIMRDPDAAENAMQRLSKGGVALALDDFGTGYSSLARLEMLPFDVVKIDQYFVRAMHGNESAETVVRSVIQLARHFGMKVVAEGVETVGAAEQLATMGCDFAQGYRYAGALPPEDALAVVEGGLDGRILAPA